MILFSGEMVRAILDGRKTQTRRVVKNQPPDHFHYHGVSGADAEAYFSDRTEEENHAALAGQHTWRRCPYGVPGDRLWVRETHHIDAPNLESARAQHEDIMGGLPVLFYRADEEVRNPDAGWRWRPSIHMPRWASRITLEVLSVRVERVQEITRKDAQAEGMPPSHGSGDPVLWFRELWNTINAKRGYSWESNPWVWVVEFRRLTGE